MSSSLKDGKTSVEITQNKATVVIMFDGMVQRNGKTGFEKRIRCLSQDDKKEYVWQWNESKGKWTTYPQCVTFLLEAAREHGMPSATWSDQGKQITVDLEKLTQSKSGIKSTKKVRRIQADAADDGDDENDDGEDDGDDYDDGGDEKDDYDDDGDDDYDDGEDDGDDDYDDGEDDGDDDYDDGKDDGDDDYDDGEDDGDDYDDDGDDDYDDGKDDGDDENDDGEDDGDDYDDDGDEKDDDDDDDGDDDYDDGEDDGDDDYDDGEDDGDDDYDDGKDDGDDDYDDGEDDGDDYDDDGDDDYDDGKDDGDDDYDDGEDDGDDYDDGGDDDYDDDGDDDYDDGEDDGDDDYDDGEDDGDDDYDDGEDDGDDDYDDGEDDGDDDYDDGGEDDGDDDYDDDDGEDDGDDDYDDGEDDGDDDYDDDDGDDYDDGEDDGDDDDGDDDGEDDGDDDYDDGEDDGDDENDDGEDDGDDYDDGGDENDDGEDDGDDYDDGGDENDDGEDDGDDDYDDDDPPPVQNSAVAKAKPDAKVKTEPASKKTKKEPNTSVPEEAPKLKSLVFKGKAPIDSHCPVKDKTHMFYEGSDIWDAMLNQTNVQNNNNKFYLIQLLEDDVSKKYYVWMRWGRVGFNGQNTLHTCGANLDEAKHIFTKKFSDKTKNDWEDRLMFVKVPGKYDLLTMDYKADDEKDEVDAPKVKEEKPVVESSKLDARVQTLVELICNVQAMEEMLKEMKYDTNKAPLGKLTTDQIKAGYQALKDIESCINNKDFGKKMVKACDAFYTRIPHCFGMKRPPLITSEEEVKLKIQLLEALGDIQIAVAMLKHEVMDKDHPVDRHYKSLQCDMTPLDHTLEDFKLVEQYLLNTHAKTHNQYALEVVDIFALKHQNEAFADVGNRILLWHGSRLTNWAGILSQGLRIAPPEAPVTGYMVLAVFNSSAFLSGFGKGLYFADMSSKSANYCFATRSKTTGILLLSEVSLLFFPLKYV
ncbi:hypothetical protein QZH41_014541 [Actinostola sp. cb2023]|nr:hypothetical protein QZH41_014541 [Actinostola sp. cb2023]